jgi:hypothetical protein
MEGRTGTKTWRWRFKVQESMSSSNGIIVQLWSFTKHEHSLLERIWAMHCRVIDMGGYNQKLFVKC